MRRRETIGWLLLFLPATALFYWKFVLTSQFSLLTSAEGVNQAYAWLQFWITSLRHGIAPLWDPYALAGHSFPGEMQTGAFNPLQAPLAVFPFNDHGVLSPHLYHLWYAALHCLAGWFMFALARELRLSRFSAFVAGICYSLAGFVVRVPWPDLLASALWLPLIFMFLLRALRGQTKRSISLQATAGGVAFGMSILAGSLHVVMMEAIAVGSAAVFYAFAHQGKPGTPSGQRLQVWILAAAAAGGILAIGCATGAIQLLPSMEYSHGAYRFLGAFGALPASQRIPYAYMADEWLPHGISVLLLPYAFHGNTGQGEAIAPYLGVFPLLAAIIGIRRYWDRLWVRYLAGLAVAAFLFSLGSYSLINGALYAIVPYLWMMREASRMVFLTDFALAILAAFGIEALISAGKAKASWPGLDRTLLGIVIACAAALFVPAVFGNIVLSPWNALSILLIFASYGLFRYMEYGNRGRAAQALILSLILFDLAAWNWDASNVVQISKNGVNHLERLLSAGGAARFLKTQPGPFRVHIAADPAPNFGDLYGIPTINASNRATLPIDFGRLMGRPDLLNGRYTLAAASEARPGAVYQDAFWKIYENPNAFPRAWMVHDAVVETDPQRAADLLGVPGFDAHRTALVDEAVRLDAAASGGSDTVRYSALEPHRLELKVHAESRGLVVLSEMFYPGWRATVNGSPALIYRVNSALRGVVAPAGESRIVMEYAPRSVFWGALVSAAALLAFAAQLAAAFLGRRRSAPKGNA